MVTSAKSDALALVDCIQIALSNKEALKASAFDLQSAQQTLKGSYSNILPSLMFSGSSSESSFPSQEGGYNQATGEITFGAALPKRWGLTFVLFQIQFQNPVPELVRRQHHSQ